MKDPHLSKVYSDLEVNCLSKGEMKEEGRKKEETKEEGATANSEPPTLTAHKEDYDSSATVSTTV